MGGSLAKSRFDAAFVVRMIGIVLFAYFFFGFMLLPCLNTLTSIFTTTNAASKRDLAREPPITPPPPRRARRP